MEKQQLKKLFNLTASNFQFILEEDFSIFFDMIHQQTKDVADSHINEKFQQLWLKTSKEWNKEFGYRGYPTLARWLEILVKKPLTNEEIAKRRKEYEEKLTLYAKFIIIWVNDPNLSISFYNRYKNPDNRHLKLMIDRYCKVKEELSDERIKKMAEYLKTTYTQNKDLFFKEMRAIAQDQNQLLLN